MSQAEFDETELQMIGEALSRVKPFGEMSGEMAQAEADLEAKVSARIDAMHAVQPAEKEEYRGGLHEHDGYKTHSHEVRADHLAVDREAGE